MELNEFQLKIHYHLHFKRKEKFFEQLLSVEIVQRWTMTLELTNNIFLQIRSSFYITRRVHHEITNLLYGRWHLHN
jgi:hypothetical protein